MSNANPWADVARMAAQSQLFQMSPNAGDAYQPVPEGFMKNLQQPSGGSKVMNALGYLGAAAGNLRQGGLVGALGGLAQRYNQRQFMKSYSAQQQAMMTQKMNQQKKTENAYTAIEQQFGLPQGSLSKGTFGEFDNMMKYQGYGNFNQGSQQLSRGDTPSHIDFGYANPAQTSKVYEGVMDRFGDVADEQSRRKQYDQGLAMQGIMEQGGSVMPDGTPTDATGMLDMSDQVRLAGGINKNDFFEQNPYGAPAAGVDYRDKGMGRNQDQQEINEKGRHNQQEEQLKQAIHQATVNNQGGYARYAPNPPQGRAMNDTELFAQNASPEQLQQWLSTRGQTGGGKTPVLNASMMENLGELEEQYNQKMQTSEGIFGFGKNTVTPQEAAQAERIKEKYNSQAAQYGYPLLGDQKTPFKGEGKSKLDAMSRSIYQGR